MQVSELREDVAESVEVVQSISHTVRALETRLISYEKSTDWTTAGMQKLLGCVWSADNLGTAKYIQAATSSSSRPALEMLPITPVFPVLFSLHKCVFASHSISKTTITFSFCF